MDMTHGARVRRTGRIRTSRFVFGGAASAADGRDPPPPSSTCGIRSAPTGPTGAAASSSRPRQAPTLKRSSAYANWRLLATRNAALGKARVSGGSLQPGWARWLAPGAIAAGAIATSLSVLAVPYAFEDDYWNLGFFHGLGGVNVWKYSVQDGRPIHALLLLAAFSAVPDIDSFRVLRLVGLAGV